MIRKGALLTGCCILALLAVLVTRALLLSPDATETARKEIPTTTDTSRVAQHFAQAMQIRTLSTQEEADRPVEEFIRFREWLAETYPAFHARTKRERIGDYTLFFTWPGRDPSLTPVLLMAHIDVVPIAPGTERDWEQPPFGGVIADGYVWGRGAIDTKGALVAMIEAADQLAARGFQPERTVMFSLGHDEETGGTQGNVVLAALLEERGVRPHWILDEGGMISDGIVPGVQERVALVGVAEKGYLTLEITARAQGGHSSMPPGQTAIGRLARAVHRLQQTPFPGSIDGPVGALLNALAPNMPFLQKVVFANQWLFAPFIERGMSASPSTDAQLRTTIAPTIINGGVKENVLPTQATATINLRLHPRDDFEDVLAHVRNAVDDETLSVAIADDGWLPSPVSPTDSEGFRHIADAISDTFPGTIIAPNLLVGGTDSRHFTGVTKKIYRFIPVILKPEDTARFHGTNERVGVENIRQAVLFYERLIRAGTQGE